MVVPRVGIVYASRDMVVVVLVVRRWVRVVDGVLRRWVGMDDEVVVDEEMLEVCGCEVVEISGLI